MVEVFDLSLEKAISPLQTAPITIGSTITYDIEVCNQGTVDAYNVEVVDYVPTGLMVTDPNWMASGLNPSQFFHTIPGPITPGTCQIVQLVATVVSPPAAPATTYVNFSEISDAEDVNGDSPPDIDSDPDNDPNNDGPVNDGTTDNTGGDEDDHDPAEIAFVLVECTICLLYTSPSPRDRG